MSAHTDQRDPLVVWLDDPAATKNVERTIDRDGTTEWLDVSLSGVLYAIVQANEGFADRDVRMAILEDLGRFTAYGVRGRLVLLRTPLGRAVFAPDPLHPGELITVTYHRTDERKLTQFWVSRASLAALTDMIRHSPEKAFNFDAVLDGVEPQDDGTV